MRFSASFLAVELMRNGQTPQKAAEIVIDRISQYYPENAAAIVVVDKDGNYAAACQNFNSFPISIRHSELDAVKIEVTKCRQFGDEKVTTGSAHKNHLNSIIFLVFVIFCFN